MRTRRDLKRTVHEGQDCLFVIRARFRRGRHDRGASHRQPCACRHRGSIRLRRRRADKRLRPGLDGVNRCRGSVFFRPFHCPGRRRQHHENRGRQRPSILPRCRMACPRGRVIQAMVLPRRRIEPNPLDVVRGINLLRALRPWRDIRQCRRSHRGDGTGGTRGHGQARAPLRMPAREIGSVECRRVAVGPLVPCRGRVRSWHRGLGLPAEALAPSSMADTLRAGVPAWWDMPFCRHVGRQGEATGPVPVQHRRHQRALAGRILTDGHRNARGRLASTGPHRQSEAEGRRLLVCTGQRRDHVGSPDAQGHAAQQGSAGTAGAGRRAGGSEEVRKGHGHDGVLP